MGLNDRYRMFVGEPRAFRSPAANRRAAAMLLMGIVVIVIALALFG